jgi:hypothetical protein
MMGSVPLKKLDLGPRAVDVNRFLANNEQLAQ